MRRVHSIVPIVAVMLTLSACVPLPPTIVAAPLPVVTASTIPTAAPPPPVTQPPVTPTPTATPTPTEPEENLPTDGTPVEPSAPIGALWGGNSTSSGSGLAADTPTPYVIPPTFGTPEVAPGSPWGDSSAGDTFRAGTDPASDPLLSTSGRIYVTYEDGGTMVCSATVINSRTDNIAITAAHCLYNAISGSMAAEVSFVPGDANNGNYAPFGVWEAEQWWMPQVFIDTATATPDSTNGDGFAVDFGYLRFPPAADGREIESITGGQGVSFRGETNGVLMLGYPTMAPFDGTSLRYCSANAMGFGGTYWPHYTASCDMTPGMSGGAWITDVDESTGGGYIVGVSSTVGSNVWSAAPLGELALQLLNDIENA